MLLYENICHELALQLRQALEARYNAVRCHGLAEQFRKGDGGFPYIERQELQISPDDNYEIQTYFRVTGEERVTVNNDRGYGANIEEVSEGEITLFCIFKKRVETSQLIPLIRNAIKTSDKRLSISILSINAKTVTLLIDEWPGYDIQYLVNDINLVSLTFTLTHRECIALI
jgi:hypothetical protein